MSLRLLSCLAVLCHAASAALAQVVSVGYIPEPAQYHLPPPPSPLLSVNTAYVAPVLPAHPAPLDIPAGGSFYRITNEVDPSVVELWYVRDQDHIATQLSAHDPQGRSIIKTRRLDTGAETVIAIEETSVSTNTLSEIRADLRSVKQGLADVLVEATGSLARVKALTVATNASTTAVRSGLIDLISLLRDSERTQKELVAEVQALRRAQSRALKDEDAP